MSSWLSKTLGLDSPSRGDDGGAAQREIEAEATREALRKRINAMYGIGADGQPMPPPAALPMISGAGVKGIFADAKLGGGLPPPQFTDAGATAARRQLEEERARLSGATADYYTDELGKDYEQATRANKFGLARRGLLGGSVETDTGASLTGDLELGATRVGEAARRAAAELDTAREQQRLNAINLANSGAGESAILAGTAGLQNALANAQNANKANLFGDLFEGGAIQHQMDSAANDPRLALLRKGTQSFFPATVTSGRVTASE